MDRIYKMKLHESFIDGNINILRVPGGWIYHLLYCNDDRKNNFVFVPYHSPSEFKGK